MKTMDGNHLTLDVKTRGRIAVVPVAGIPGKDGANGQDGASAPSPIDPVLAFEGVLAGHVE